ncbi:hypothetical protein MPH_01355 [Macrophomina phaseolina MS6]|uniref:Uncharacterized protein n=1 Tax=Macrophomina phaseolina (strain MS6) TaxID=1126212 RepID=K2S314_MACPH|nr:hypothetical protein MPH_01355 [Macrophomina phaseolina MS6]
MAQYHDKDMAMHPAALYTLADLSDNEMQRLQQECESQCTDAEAGSSVLLAPKSRFVGQALRAVYEYHLELGAQDTYDHRYFIVAIHKDWEKKGVLLVTLDDDCLECKVESFRVHARDAGIIILNLQVANSDWAEEKENCELHSDNDDDDDDGDNNDEDDDDDDNDDNDDARGDNNDGGDDLEEGPPAPSKNHTLGYYIPLYIHPALSPTAVLSRLEPGPKTKPAENHACRIQGTLPPTGDITAALRLHPVRCAKNPFLHKTHLLVLDTPDPHRSGMLLARLDWDGETTGRSKASLLALGASAPHDAMRVPFDCAEGVQARFITLASGAAAWPSPEERSALRVAVFQYGTGRKERGFGANLLDAQAGRRRPGDERVQYAGEFVRGAAGGLERVVWNFEEAVRRFPWFCWEKRFVEGMERKYFVCVDGEDVREKGVLLVRREWDGNVARGPEELLGLEVLEGDVKTVRVPVKEALGLLEKGRKGGLGGVAEEVAEFFRS